MGSVRALVVYIAMTFLRRVVMLSRSRKFGGCPEPRFACAFGTIQASIVLLALLLLMHPSRAFAANPDLETVLTGSRQRIEKLDYRASGHLTRVEADGKRTSYKFVGKARWFPDGLRLLCEISGPGPDEKTSLLLHMSVSGHLTIEAILPGEKTASVLPFERWNDPLVGTDFSYEDMVESQFFWKNQELLAPEKYGARDCFVLKSTPGPQDRTYDGSVTSWIDRSILFPVHVVKTLRGTGQQKEFIYYGLRQVGGVWSASQVEAKVQGKPGSSILAIEGGSGKANLERKDFDLGQSSAPAEKVK
jgi:Outer membrane lipoprotein-sorting protein